jgi:hypothetical protein
LNEGYLREFLYGRARSVRCAEGVREVEFGGSSSVCVFRDPLYAGVSGLFLIDRRPAEATQVGVRALLNPWATHRLTPDDIGVCCFAEDPVASAEARALPALGGEARGPDALGALRVCRWYDGTGARVTLA